MRRSVYYTFMTTKIQEYFLKQEDIHKVIVQIKTRNTVKEEDSEKKTCTIVATGYESPSTKQFIKYQ